VPGQFAQTGGAVNAANNAAKSSWPFP